MEKLYALSKSSANENEASTARRLLDKLCIKYNVDNATFEHLQPYQPKLNASDFLHVVATRLTAGTLNTATEANIDFCTSIINFYQTYGCVTDKQKEAFFRTMTHIGLEDIQSRFF